MGHQGREEEMGSDRACTERGREGKQWGMDSVRTERGREGKGKGG